MCNTQLHVGPSAFRPLYLLFGGIPLMGRMYCWSLMPDLLLHFQLCALGFVLLMCPLHLDRSASFGASILWGVMSLSLHDVP